MKKVLIGIFFAFLLTISFARTSSAAILTIDKEGQVEWKVLGAQTENNALETPKPDSVSVNSEYSGSGKPEVVISKDDEKFNMSVSSAQGTKNIDLSQTKEDILEIEERQDVQKVKVSLTDGKITLRQKGISAVTDFPLKIDPESAEISLKTGTGDKYLSVLPFDASQSALRTKLISRINENRIEILEEEGKLAYKVSGEKVINLFNIYDYAIPVSSFISASTGEVIKIDSPSIIKYIGFLFI